MNKKSKLLKIWMRTATYLTVIAAFVSFTEPLYAGWIREWDDNNNNHTVQVVFGRNHKVDDPPANSINITNFSEVEFTGDDNVRVYMSNILPQINRQTHIQFWVSKSANTTSTHIQRALFGAAGAQENVYKWWSINNPGAIIPNVTFDLHTKH